MLEKDDVADPTSRHGKQFRRRFGIPFALYQRIVTDAAVWFPPKPDAFGRLPVPIELKVLGSLRILAKGSSFDGIAELSMMHESTMQEWHHKFLSRFVTEFRDVWISYPKTVAEAAPIAAVYERLGLPGAVDSTDVTHVAWVGLLPS